MLDSTRREVRAIAHRTALDVFQAQGVWVMTSQMIGTAVDRQLGERMAAATAAVRRAADEEVRRAVGELKVPEWFARQEEAVRALAAASAAESFAVSLEEARPGLLDVVREEVARAYAEAAPPVVEVSVPSGAVLRLGEASHRVLPDLLLALGARCHVLLVGPAGTGKSTLAKQAAAALGLDFHALSLGPTTPMSKVFGYFDAHGAYHDTPFRRAYEHGGVMLLDELDNGHPGLLGELNQALALGVCAFADGMVAAHEDFRVVATGNTYGTGADRQYVGRQALDAATLDRFLIMDVPIDTALERRLALALAPSRQESVMELLETVWELRETAAAKRLPVQFSPRASIDGAKLLHAGATLDQVLRWRVARGLSDEHLVALDLDDLVAEAGEAGEEAA